MKKCGVFTPGAPAQLEHRQRDVGRGGRHLPRSVALGAEAELIQVDALPPHRDLDHPVQLAQGTGARHQQAPPHHRTDPEQPHLNLNDPGRVRTGQCGISGWFGLLRGSGHKASIPRSTSPRCEHHTLLMVPV